MSLILLPRSCYTPREPSSQDTSIPPPIPSPHLRDPALSVASVSKPPIITNVSHPHNSLPLTPDLQCPLASSLGYTPAPRITTQFPPFWPVTGPNPESPRPAQTIAQQWGAIVSTQPSLQYLHVDPPSSCPQRERGPVTMATPVRTPAGPVPRRLGGSGSGSS